MNFNYIPRSLQLPLVWAELDGSQAGSFANYQRALIIGYKRAAGTGVADTFERAGSPDAVKIKGGRGSQIAGMAEAWFKNNKFDETWFAYVAEPSGGTAATGTIVVAGPATAAGIIPLYIAGRKVNVSVNASDAASAIATAIAAAINANPDLPVSASAATATVTLTARWKGIDGNYIDVRAAYLGALGGEAVPAGVTLTITAMASGVGTPDLSALIGNLGDQPFDTVVTAWTDTTSLNALEAEFDHKGDVGRWSWLRQIYGHVFSARDGSYGDLGTFGNARNDAHCTCFGYYGSPTPCWERAAMFAAQAHRSLMNDPARPLHTLPLNGMLPAADALRFTKGEQNALAYDGISVCEETDDGKCQIKTSFSMYQKNAHGLDDNAFLKIQTLATLAYVMRALRFRITQKFPRHKIADDGTRYGPGQAITTPKAIKAEICAHYRELEYRGLVENFTAFKTNLIVERNADNPNRVDVLYPPDLVNQIDVFAILNQFRLQYQPQLPDQPLAIA